MWWWLKCFVCFVCALLSFYACEVTAEVLPEGPSRVRTEVPQLRAPHAMVVTAHQRASEAGLAMLQRGGNAADAAIAASLVLGVVEPYASGLGGGGFVMYYDREHSHMQAYDGREVAPSGAHSFHFVAKDGKVIPFSDAVVGGRAAGVPGLVALLSSLHRALGVLPWNTLFGPALEAAEGGFLISQRFYQMLLDLPEAKKTAEIKTLFFDKQARPFPIGTRIYNPALAQTLRRLASHGSDGFYRGPVAQQIVHAARHAVPSDIPTISLKDLAAYRAVEREPVCRVWQGKMRVCSMPPPSSGGIVLLQILGMLEVLPSDASFSPQGSVVEDHLRIEATRLAFADRAAYIADPEVTPVPVEALLSDSYLRQRAGLISPRSTISYPIPGLESPSSAVKSVPESPCTTHLSVVDAMGNAVSMTATVESIFGSGVVAAGMILNNEMTDFLLDPNQNEGVNQVRSGARPRSSMTPVIVTDLHTGKVLSVLGSPGGSRIISYVAQTFDHMRRGQSMQDAIAAPRVVTLGSEVELEKGRATKDDVHAWEKLGHTVRVVPLPSGLHGIEWQENAYESGVDPRREGVALGY